MELYIEPVRRTRDNRGRFLRGNNECRGKKKTFSKSGMKKIMKNLRKAIATRGRKGTNNGHKCVGITPDGSVTMYPSAAMAERAIGICHSTVSSRCRGMTKNRFIGGRYWYWEDDARWIEFYNKLNSPVK